VVTRGEKRKGLGGMTLTLWLDVYITDMLCAEVVRFFELLGEVSPQSVWHGLKPFTEEAYTVMIEMVDPFFAAERYHHCERVLLIHVLWSAKKP
jgi:hypothetical protein